MNGLRKSSERFPQIWHPFWGWMIVGSAVGLFMGFGYQISEVADFRPLGIFLGALFSGIIIFMAGALVLEEIKEKTLRV